MSSDVTGHFVLRTDGGARGNPGPAAAAFVLEDPQGHVVRSGGRFIGDTTNNVAEYEALVWGLATALDQRVKDLEVRSDSELVVKQVRGEYRVRNANLAQLHGKVLGLLAHFRSARIMHVRRADNTAADELANRAMDLRSTVGDGVESSTPAQGSLFS